MSVETVTTRGVTLLVITAVALMPFALASDAALLNSTSSSPHLLLNPDGMVNLNSGGSCSSALDCNARACYSCTCTSKQCQCGSGFSGEHCETAFCTDRNHGCSGHGECQMSLYNITCECDRGYIGGHCETKTCDLDCKHGGTPYADCSRCDGCKGDWGGKLCDKWQGKLPQKVLMDKLSRIANESQKMLDNQRKFNPICKQGHECVGWGVDGFTGRPTAFPIVYLSYDPTRSDKRFNGMNEPVEVVANHIVSPVWAGVDGGNAFPRIEDFVHHVNTQYHGASPAPKGTNGIYSSDFAQAFNTYFQKRDDRALSVVRASRSYITMSLPVDPVTHTRQYNIDRHANDFINSLPPAYETEDHKTQFRYFIEKYGTSFVTSAALGGLVEHYSSWKTWLTDARLGGFTASMLVRNAQLDFGSKTGLPGPSGNHDPGYVRNTVREPLFCLGGDPTVSCEKDFQKWANTIPDSLVLLNFELAPISDLVSDPDVKEALDQAVKEYIKEQQAEWDAVNKCPVNCGGDGAGSCTAGQESSCKCKYSGLVGRQCSGCAPMTVKATYTNIEGYDFSNTGTVDCSGKSQIIWEGPGYCRCGLAGAANRNCHGSTTVGCSREPNGNLVAHLKQDSCQAPCPKNFEDEESQDKDTVTNTEFERRLLSGRLRGLADGSKGTCTPEFIACSKFKAVGGNTGSKVSSSKASATADSKNDKGSGQCITSGGKTGICTVTATCEFQ